jgi:hypothetical protein
VIEAAAAAIARARSHADGQPSIPLSRCANLAPAATGTTTLSKEWLSNLRVSSVQNGSKHTESAGFVHHSHHLNLTHLYALGARCFLITLRQPSERLVSAYLYDYYRMHARGGLYHAQFGLTTPRAFVHALTDSDQKARRAHDAHLAASDTFWSSVHSWQHMVHTSVPLYNLAWAPHGIGAVRTACDSHPATSPKRNGTLLAEARSKYDRCMRSAQAAPDPQDCFRNEVGDACGALRPYQRRGASTRGGACECGGYDGACGGERDSTSIALCGGSVFLIPQINYLMGLQHLGDAELHVVCTGRLGTSFDGFRRFAKLYGGELRTAAKRTKPSSENPSDAFSTNLAHRANASSQEEFHMAMNGKLTREYFLSDEQKQLVMDCLYADDAALYERFCGDGAPSPVASGPTNQ